MFNIREIPSFTYATLLDYMNGKESAKIAGNTIARTVGQGITIELHGNEIAFYAHDGDTIELSDGHYQSSTTKQRLNQLLPIGQVYQKDYEWYYFDGQNDHEWDGKVIFANGELVNA